MNFSFKCFLSNVGEVNLLLFFSKKKKKKTVLIFCYLMAKNQLKCGVIYEKNIVMWVGEDERIINCEQLSHTILSFPLLTWNN